MSSLPAPCLCAVTARRRLRPDARTRRDELLALSAFLEEAIDAGVDLVQVREPDVEHGALVAAVRAAVAHAVGTPTRILVNQRVQVAADAHAHGVHLKASSARLDRNPRWPADWIVGRSAHGVDEPLAVDDPQADERLDYWVFGTVFATASKPAGIGLAGLDALRRFAAVTPLPVLAIGGVTPARATACLAAGAAGIAAIAPFLPPGAAPGAMGAGAAVTAFRKAFGEAVAP
jgi:thiamine-phosphate pyrophosphorylase